ncbi:MAG: hypothetical protein WDN25_14440 [Acetobacteraceae bacterium]
MSPEPPAADYATPNARATFAYLRSMLPEQVDTDPDACAERDRRAMDAVAALRPDDEFEARLAARIVAMDAHAADSLRLAGLAADPAAQYRCRAQAAAMARQSDAGLRGLLRLHTLRDRALAAAYPDGLPRAGYPLQPAGVTEPAAVPSSLPEAGLEPPPEGIAAEADFYAVLYPERVRRIRAAGGLPASLDFGPPEPALVHALVHGTGARLRACDPPSLGVAA